MKQFTRLALALSLPLLALNAAALPTGDEGANLPAVSGLRYKAQNHKTLLNTERNATISRLNKRLAPAADGKSIDPDFTMLNNSQYEYIDGPNGSIYLCKAEYETKKVTTDGYTTSNIVGYKFSIYDTNFELVGEIKDKVRLDSVSDPSNPEVRVAAMGLSPVMTRRFFNTDDKFEVMVYFSMNTVNYVNNERSVAYQFGGEKDEEGNDVPICTIEGNLSDVLEVKTDQWSENFYLTFASDYKFPSDPDDDSFAAYVNSQGVIIETYKKASYSSQAPEKFFEYKMRLNDWPGDQENSTPLISRDIDGKPYYIINGYTDGLWVFGPPEDDYSFASQNINEDTKFFVDIYQPQSLDNPNLIQHTEIDVKRAPGSNIFATFYFLGNLGYRDDINYDYCDEPGKANLLITTKNWDGAEMASTSSYYLYGPDGTKKATIGTEVDGVLAMSDIKGQEPEYMFIIANDGQYAFEFVNPYNASIHHTFDQVLPWNGAHESLYVNADRVADGDSYKYCFELMANAVDNDGNEILRMAWINTQGEIIDVDQVNVGPNVTYALVNVSQPVIGQYLFDTTPEREYMVLVKRANLATSKIQEEFLVATASTPEKPVGRILLELKPDLKMGVLGSISVVNTEADPMLWITYYDNTSDKYSQLIYRLPLEKFVGGDGTAENPYQIATIGDLQCVRDNLSAHYELVADIDAANFDFATIGTSTKPFMGSIKGNGHSIANLTVNNPGGYNAMFAYISQAQISDLTFVNPVIEINGSNYNALVAANMQSSTLSNVHAVGLHVNSESTGSFGGLVCTAAGTSQITGCSVINASIELPNASPVGGVVAETRTSSTIVASAFGGKILAKSVAGGILGTSGPNAGSLADCHVDADITAGNIVGGIVGDMDTRINIDHCYVEGILAATETYGTRIVKKGYAVGGIAGSVSTYYENNESADEGQQTQSNTVISNCLVNLETITTPELPEGNQSSVHRIAGFTSINDLQPDWDNIDDYMNIDKFLPTSAEPGLSNNYVVASLDKVDSEVAADATSTEGANVDPADLNEEFFTNLGFKFGTSAEQPWNELATTDPALYFEFGACFAQSEITAVENSDFNAELIIVSRTPVTVESFIDGFAGEISDESVVEMNGDITVVNNVAYIGFTALTPGSTEFTANVNGSLAKVKFNVVEDNSSITEVSATPGSLKITFDGLYAACPDASLQVYAADGRRVAAGFGRVSLASLAYGIYIVAATDAAGNRATAKFLLH